MTWPLRQKWFWMLFLVLLAAVVSAFALVFLLVSLSPNLLFLVFIAVVVAWYVFSSYRKWVRTKHDEENASEMCRNIR